jgi:hypothetical protein
MNWADELDNEPKPERQTGLDWIYTISEVEQSRQDRRMARARRKLNRAERKYTRKLKGS